MLISLTEGFNIRNKANIITEKAEEIIKPVIESNRMELVDVTWGHKNGSWNLCVFIDKEDGVTLDDCEIINREVSDLLDRTDLIDHSYVLEVSSPGLDRPLNKKEDFERFARSNVKITTTEAIQGQKKFKGMMTGIREDNRVVMQTDKGQEFLIPLQIIAKANLWYRPDFKKRI